MKASFIFKVSLCLAVALHAGIVSAAIHFGNDVEFSDTSNHSPNYLLGSKISVTTAIDLTDVGIIFKSSGVNGQVGIYSDVAGLPNALLADTGPFAVTSTGAVETPVPTVFLPVGDYWFMAVFDSVAHIGIADGPQVDFVDFAFGSPLPAVFPSPIIYSGQAFNYYLVGNPPTASVPEPASLMVWLILISAGSGCALVYSKRSCLVATAE